MREHAFDQIPMRRVGEGKLQGKCPWCDFVTPAYPFPKQVINSVRKHIKSHGMASLEEDGGQRRTDLAAPK
jgi:hypothetical protein